MGDAAVVGLHIGVQFAERGEIGVVQQVLCCLVHQVKIELEVAFPT